MINNMIENKKEEFSLVCSLSSEAATATELVFNFNADGDCSHKIKRRLLLGRIAMTNLDGGPWVLCCHTQDLPCGMWDLVP